jgi:hypothetical protein
MPELEFVENGTAYPFLKMDSGCKAVKNEIPVIRDVIGTPSEMSFYVCPLDEASPKIPEDLKRDYEAAKKADCNVFVEAKYLGETNVENVKTAKELGFVCNQLYVNLEKGSFIGEILYKEKDKYSRLD